MSPRRPSTSHPGARSTPAGQAAVARGVPAPRAARAGAERTAATGSGRASRSARPTTGRSGGRGASTRPSSRTQPGTGRGPAGTAVEPPVRVPRMFTVRALVLFVVLLLAFVLLLPTVRAYVAQQAENAELAAEVVAARERTDDLGAELERWDDPAYVAAQARERLAFVRPGETAYRVVDPEIVPDPTAPAVPAAGTGPALVPPGTTTPWYATIWESVRVAGEAEVGVVPDDGTGTTEPAATPAKTPAPVPAGTPAPTPAGAATAPPAP